MTSVKISTIRDLAGLVVWVGTNTTTYSYPRFGKTLEEAWEELRSSIVKLGERMGRARTAQLLDMCDQAQQHFRAAYDKKPLLPPEPGEEGFEDLKLGSRLMQDVEWVARGREPFAYPKELYRWPQIAGSRPAGDPDLEREFDA